MKKGFLRDMVGTMIMIGGNLVILGGAYLGVILVSKGSNY